MLRTEVGHKVLALCRKKRISFASFGDALVEQTGTAILDGRRINIMFQWPSPKGMR